MMIKIYLLKYAFTNGIHTFEVPDKGFEEDRVWVREQSEFYKRTDIALSEEESLNKLRIKVNEDLEKEHERHLRAMNKLELFQLNLKNGTLPKITEH